MSALDEKSGLIGPHRANHGREKQFTAGQLHALKKFLKKPNTVLKSLNSNRVTRSEKTG